MGNETSTPEQNAPNQPKDYEYLPNFSNDFYGKNGDINNKEYKYEKPNELGYGDYNPYIPPNRRPA